MNFLTLVLAASVWPQILSSLGLPPGSAALQVATGQESADQLRARAAAGAIVILEGDSPAARSLGFQPAERKVSVRNIVDARHPSAEIIWEKSLELPVVTLPAAATVFAKERWEGIPVLAGLKSGAGGILWMAAPPGERGFDRYPFLPQALAELGLRPVARSRNLWAFFDSSYRLRADIEWLAPRWRDAGFAALQIAAWHYWEPDAQRDAWLRATIDACHRNGILVYAWLELPHVSERFWSDHPEWREKTAAGQDAHLDWRKLMNLSRPDCAESAAKGVDGLLARFDWDGVNLAELYFESLEGYLNPARFTPFNDDVRRAFKAEYGEDPADYFRPESPRYHGKTADGMRRFLDWRAQLAQKLQEEWLVRLTRPNLDLVLTHVDDRFDATMRDKIGADAARLLPAAARSNATFMIEDPATLWHLGPQRYPDIAKRYASIAPAPERLAIDINVVERYQDVYPTKQQSGIELLQLVHLAAQTFPRVALYFESSLLRSDWPWLTAAAAVYRSLESRDGVTTIDSPSGVGVAWNGGARVDGRPWPVLDGSTVWLPPGRHSIERGDAPPLRLIDLNGQLTEAEVLTRGLRFRYASKVRAIARYDRVPKRIELDGQSWQGGFLPKGEHEVRAFVD